MSFQTYIENIKAKTGRGPDDSLEKWMNFVSLNQK